MIHQFSDEIVEIWKGEVEEQSDEEGLGWNEILRHKIQATS